MTSLLWSDLFFLGFNQHSVKRVGFLLRFFFPLLLSQFRFPRQYRSVLQPIFVLLSAAAARTTNRTHQPLTPRASELNAGNQGMMQTGVAACLGSHPRNSRYGGSGLANKF